MGRNVDNKILSTKDAYLAMCEYLKREIALNEGRDVDVRGVVAELELIKPWGSAAEGCTEIFEECVENVLEGTSVFDAENVSY